MMNKVSLPITLQLALQQHAAAADISDDDELKRIISDLAKLNEKVEAMKQLARQKKKNHN